MRERLSLPKSARIAATSSALALLVLLFVPRGEPASSAPTPSETVLYQENFEDGQAHDWELESGWAIVQDSAGNRVLRGQGHSWARYFGDGWADYTLKLRVKLIKGGIHLNYRCCVSDCRRYLIGFNERELYLGKDSSCETGSDLRVIPEPRSLGRWYEVKITGSGGKIDICVNGSLKLSYTDPDPLIYGRIALESLKNSEVYVDDIVVSGKPSPTPGLHWVRTGGPLGGLGYDIRMRPDNPDIMYVTDAWSGVHISTDSGLTWSASNEGIATRAGPSGDAIPVFSLTIDPHNPDVIWCGTQNRRGIWKSTDGGKTWARKDNGVVENEGISFRGFTVDPRSSDIVYAAAEISSFAWAGEDRPGREFDQTKGVVYKTTNGGVSWTAVWRGDNLARYIWLDPADSETVYVSTGIFDREPAYGRGVGVLKSADAGKTWSQVNQGLGNLYVGSLFLSPADPDVLLAGTGNNQYWDKGGVYRSEDGGATWRSVLEGQGQKITSVEFALADPSIAYAASVDSFYRSEDGGITWTAAAGGGTGWGPPGVRAGFPIDLQVDPRDPDRLFANNYGGGNFLSEDGGCTWSVASTGYTGAQVRDVAVSPADPSIVYAAARSGLFSSASGGAEWSGLSFQPHASLEWYVVAFDPQNGLRVLAANNWERTLLETTDRGRSWHPIANCPGTKASWRAVAFAPSNPRVVYAGSSAFFSSGTFDDTIPAFGIQVTQDGGATWRSASDLLSQDANVAALAVHPEDPLLAYAATGNHGILKTIDGGRTWAARNSGLPTQPCVLSIALDPRNHETVFAGLRDGGLYRSTDGGNSWRTASDGMSPEATVSDIVTDPARVGVLYAADLRTGVYRSTDAAQTWVKINDGLRTRAVKALAISADGKVLYAGTEGEGVFRLDLGSSGG